MIEVRGLAKSFGTNSVLRGIDLTVQRGEVAVVIVVGCIAVSLWRSD